MDSNAAISSMTDEALVELAAQRRDERALRELFDRYYTPLTIFATRIVSDGDEASDIVQNLFVSIHEGKVPSPLGSFRSFAARAVRNASLNVLKHRGVMRQHEQATLAEASDLAPDSADDLVEQDEAQAKVAKALAQLPEQCRKVFSMSRFDGLSNQEIADALSISKRTVETQISNALRTLRKLLLPVLFIILL